MIYNEIWFDIHQRGSTIHQEVAAKPIIVGTFKEMSCIIVIQGFFDSTLIFIINSEEAYA